MNKQRIVSIILLIISIGLFVSGIKGCQFADEAQTWPIADAIITDIDIHKIEIEYDTSSGYDTVEQYQVTAYYNYVVDDNVYKATRTLRTFDTFEEASIYKSKSIGEKDILMYDPNDPALHTYDPGAYYWAGLSSILLSIIAIGISIYLWRMV